MIQNPTYSGLPGHLDQTSPHRTEDASERELDILDGPETVRAASVEKSPSSEEENRLKEEALLNAVIEIEELIKTTAQAAYGRVTQEQTEQALKTDTDFTFVPSETLGAGFAQPDNLAGFANGQPSEAEIATFNQDLNIPADVIRRLNSNSSSERAVGLSDLARFGAEHAYHMIAGAFDDQSEDVRIAAAHALFDWQPDPIASFARTLREGSPDRRRRIGAALAASGLAGEAIGNLAGQTRELGYEAFSLLFLMTKAGEVQPLLRAVQEHPNIEIRLAVVRLLALNGQADIVPSFRELAVRGVLPSDVRTAVIEAIYELGRQIPREVS